MNRTRIIVLILFSILGLILIVFFSIDSGDDDGIKYSWYETYRVDSDQPYGTTFIRQLLETYRPDGEFILNRKKSLRAVLDSASMQNTDYVFIGHDIYLNTADEDALVNFIYSGNDAFIASVTTPESLINRIHKFECAKSLFYINNLQDSVTLNFYHDTLRTARGYNYAYRSATENQGYYWNVVNADVFCDSTRSLIALGYLNPNEPNFVRIPFGEGNLYLHTNPLVFTNYFMTQPEKVEYASGVFSHLRGKHIIWDEFSKLYLSPNIENNGTPLSYILQQPSLKHAWWMLLFTVILYVIFAARRTQRVIPVLEQKTNTSLEYVRLISTLHFQNGNHLDMARKKMKYFLYFIRSKYGIHAQTLKDEHMLKLAEKSKVNVSDVQSIFSQYHLIERNSYANIEATRLLDLYFAIENFYKNCK